MTELLLQTTSTQHADWIFAENKTTGYLGFAGVVIRKRIFTKYEQKQVFWTCPHIHRTEESAVACAQEKIKIIIYRL
jgi:hypothetical protein